MGGPWEPGGASAAALCFGGNWVANDKGWDWGGGPGVTMIFAGVPGVFVSTHPMTA